MDEFNRYLSEAIRIRRSIQVYSEIFDSRDAIETLSDKSIEFTAIIKRSMHDEILMSLARLFDTDGYNHKGNVLEYLSQRNLVLEHEQFLDENLNKLRHKTADIWQSLSVKTYRDIKLAHNDKATLFNREHSIRHNVTFASAIELIDTSITLVVGLMARSGQVSVKPNLEDIYENVGSKFIESIK
ncbi:hypothetical protein J4H13_22715 [Vibrio alginolyticus]|uniref:AbiU2 domain-containing protein n=1 Tax=Vibrio alginolyticus TaxID=663 RepID=UPI001BD4C926|nr:hypothetical protein [Vibrio alginolyticus]MBS9875959.1 hypothetical protein [Vibrio alginolyticus]